MIIRYLTHPEVQVDPAVPVPLWGLSSIGRGRAVTFAATKFLAGTTRIVSSAERKAIETAQIVGLAFGVAVEIRPAMHENDRSATGYLPAAEFEMMADRFFAEPALSVRGWERAVDAQRRIADEAEAALAQPSDGDILFVGHGGVGTLLFCHYAGLDISRRHDQPAGGGYYFALEADGRRIRHGWRNIDEASRADL